MTAAVLPILWGAALTVLISWCSGKLLFHQLGLTFHRIEEDLLAFVTGSACVSTLVFALCTVHAARKGVFTFTVVVALFVASKRGALRRSGASLPKVHIAWFLALLIPFCVYTYLYFFNALAPEASPDGSMYHLGNVVRWWHDRGFVRYSGSMYADLSQGVEMLFLFAYSFGRHSAASMVHFSFLVALPWLIWCYGRRFGLVKPAAVGAVLIFLSPVTGRAGTAAYNDVAVACVAFALFYVLQIWSETGDGRVLYVAGLLAGFCFALKYTAGIGILYALGYTAWHCRRARSSLLRPMMILVLCIAVPALPWMVKNWIWFGNPLSPFFNTYFPNPHIHIWFEEEYRASMALYGEIKSYRELPWLVTVNGAYVGGLFGPWLLLTPLGLLALRDRRGRMLLAACLVFGLPAFGNSGSRLLLPFATFSAIALGIALTQMKMAPLVLVIQTIICWPAVVNLYASPWAWRLNTIPYAAALRRVPEEEYLRKNLQGYAMARAIERLVPQQDRILVLGQVPQGYTTRRLWNWYESAEGKAGQLAVWAGQLPSMQPNWEMKFDFVKEDLAAVRVLQTAKAHEMWSVSEMRVYEGDKEVERSPRWSVSARPSPWDAPLAFDNGPISAWSTWEAIRPGMFLRLDFNSPVRVDRVSLFCTPGQWAPKVQLEGLTRSGKWKTLSMQPSISEIPPPPGIRRLASDELKALGFQYVVVKTREAPGIDLRRYEKYWEVSSVFEADGERLYRLD